MIYSVVVETTAKAVENILVNKFFFLKSELFNFFMRKKYDSNTDGTGFNSNWKGFYNI